VIDQHLHLVPHGTTGRFTADTVREYARAAAESGVTDIAVTEHLFRFPDVRDVLGEWWTADDDPRLVERMAEYVEVEGFAQTLAEYVDVVLEAAADPGDGAARVRLGLEVDLFSGRMEEVARLLGRHSWDVLLGSVHWLGSWGFDQWGDPVFGREWGRREADDVWVDYAGAVEELAASEVCDVLAHVDLVKGGGYRAPAVEAEVHERLVAAAAGHDLCIELSSNGWRHPAGTPYPSDPLLAAARAAGVGLTLASDAHDASRVGERHRDLVAIAAAAGYDEVMLFEGRVPKAVPLFSEGD